jgi:hypothetical protein
MIPTEQPRTNHGGRQIFVETAGGRLVRASTAAARLTPRGPSPVVAYATK